MHKAEGKKHNEGGQVEHPEVQGLSDID